MSDPPGDTRHGGYAHECWEGCEAMSESAKEKIERLLNKLRRDIKESKASQLEVIDLFDTACAIHDEALSLTAHYEACIKNWEIQQEENKRLTEENTGLQRMITCEHTGRVECARDKPNPPDKILSRCYSCQITLAKLENASLRQFATKNASKVETLVAESKKTASLQEASRFYRVCDACSTSSFEPTPDGERCGMCYLVEENERLRMEIALCRALGGPE